MKRIAVFGASGFVGATLVERLWQTGESEVRPIIHSSGNAARLARFARPLVTADVLQPATLATALEGCTHVVNCSRGPADVMIDGLRNMLEASRRAGVTRFVHLSSVAVYGEGLPTECLEGPEEPRPAPNTYGWTKLQQDQLVERTAREGLSCAVVCPPNISGSYSPFLLDVLQALRRREFVLVGDGRLPCELVDVENLAQAILRAVEAPEPGPQRILVTDGGATTWGDVIAALAPLAGHDAPVPSIPLERARELTAQPVGKPPSVRRAARHLLSSGVRSALRNDPWIAGVERSVKTYIKRLPAVNRALRGQFEERPTLKKPAALMPASDRLIRQQLRNVRYSQARARAAIGYVPAVSPGQSMNAFRAWYRDLHGWRDPYWSLTRHLYE